MISQLMFDQAQIYKDQRFIVRKNQTYNNNEQCSKKMLKDCVYSIDQGVQVLYTLILLFLLELASHSVPLILYTNNDFAHSPVKVLTLNFLFFSISLFSLSGAQSHVFPIQTQWTRHDLYTSISHKPSYQKTRSQSDRILTTR